MPNSISDLFMNSRISKKINKIDGIADIQSREGRIDGRRIRWQKKKEAYDDKKEQYEKKRDALLGELKLA